MVNICVPVLKRYDLLRQMVASCERSITKPDAYYIINNGRDEKQLMAALGDFDIAAKVHTPKKALGVAASWNWFIAHVAEERVIVNDDVTLAPTSLTTLLASRADLVIAKDCGFACYVMRDACVKKIGLFDETISPGYAYYEDEDYLQRLDGRGTREPSAVMETLDVGVRHTKSSTLIAASHHEILEHHEKFLIAQRNYAQKWGIEKEFGLEPMAVGR